MFYNHLLSFISGKYIYLRGENLKSHIILRKNISTTSSLKASATLVRYDKSILYGLIRLLISSTFFNEWSINIYYIFLMYARITLILPSNFGIFIFFTTFAPESLAQLVQSAALTGQRSPVRARHGSPNLITLKTTFYR